MYAEMNQLSITQREEVMTRDTKNLFSWVHSIKLGEENPPYNHYLTLESVLSKSLFPHPITQWWGDSDNRGEEGVKADAYRWLKITSMR